MLLTLILGTFIAFNVIYILVISKKSIKKKDKRCEKMLKELENEPYNISLGESIYGSKTKSVKK